MKFMCVICKVYRVIFRNLYICIYGFFNLLFCVCIKIDSYKLSILILLCCINKYVMKYSIENIV